MSGFLPKKFNGKMSEPFLPFAIAGLLVLYGINSGASAMMNSEEFRDDPRNPRPKDRDAKVSRQEQPMKTS